MGCSNSGSVKEKKYGKSFNKYKNIYTIDKYEPDLK